MKTEAYRYLPRNTKNVLRSSGRDPRTGIDGMKIGSEQMPIDEIERKYIQDCDTLAGMFDGTITESDHFFDGALRYEGPIDHAVYLDKSGRPVRYLLKELWSQLSSGTFPESSFRNIDKEQWRSLMPPDTDSVQKPSVDDISLDNYEKHHDADAAISLEEHLARLRATYLDPKYLQYIDEYNLSDVWQYPTILDGKHVAIVDEVKSSGATLKIADLLMRAAVPEAKFEPVYWSVPHRHEWETYDRDGNPTGREFAVESVPVWYDSNSAYGRGIGERNPALAERSRSKRQRIGKYVLSNAPHDMVTLERTTMDQRSHDIRNDLLTLAERFKSKMIDYVPSRDRNNFAERIEAYWGISHAEWLKRRKKRR